MLRNAYSVLKGLLKNAYGDTDAADRDRVKQLFRLYNSRGLTSVADRGASVEAIDLYRKLRDEPGIDRSGQRDAHPVAAVRDHARRSSRSSINWPSYDNHGRAVRPAKSGVGDHWKVRRADEGVP